MSPCQRIFLVSTICSFSMQTVSLPKECWNGVVRSYVHPLILLTENFHSHTLGSLSGWPQFSSLTHHQHHSLLPPFYDVSHFGLDKIKKRQIEHLAAVRKRELNADRETWEAAYRYWQGQRCREDSTILGWRSDNVLSHHCIWHKTPGWLCLIRPERCPDPEGCHPNMQWPGYMTYWIAVPTSGTRWLDCHLHVLVFLHCLLFMESEAGQKFLLDKCSIISCSACSNFPKPWLSFYQSQCPFFGSSCADWCWSWSLMTWVSSFESLTSLFRIW